MVRQPRPRTRKSFSADGEVRTIESRAMDTPSWAVGMQRIRDWLYKDRQGVYHLTGYHRNPDAQRTFLITLSGLLPLGSGIEVHPPEPAEVWTYCGHRPTDAQAALDN